MPGVSPRLSPLQLVIVLSVIFVVFIALGVPISIQSSRLYEKVIPYHTDPEGAIQKSFNVKNNVKGPVYVMYQLEDYYQNHRRFVNSRNYDQLKGKKISDQQLYDCDPRLTKDDDPHINPCGIAAQMLFNDSFSLKKDDGAGLYSPVQWVRDDLVWKSDRKLFKRSDDAWTDVSKDDFIVWMKTAALPDFRKPYARLPNGLPAGDYIVEISNIYTATKGPKSIVFSQHTWFGGKNPFIGILFLVVGGTCGLLALLIGLKACLCPRKFSEADLQSLMRSIELKELGNAAFGKGDYMAALEHYSEAIKVDRNNGSLWGNRSAAYFYLGLYDKCIEDANYALELVPTMAKYYLRKGMAHLKMGQNYSAKIAFQNGLAKEPGNNELRAALAERKPGEPNYVGDNASMSYEQKRDKANDLKNEGNKFFQQKKYAEAIAKYNQAIVFNPSESIFYNNRAACHTELGQFDDAIHDCKMAITLGKTNGVNNLGNTQFTEPRLMAKAYTRLGVAYEKKNMLAEAAQAYRDGIAYESSDLLKQKLADVLKKQ
ncbi:putative ALA-interacting subunit 5 [Blattamonas nauphoetae]|uniref:ALA-interacting subunit 5 n=1 Tax=Blattamonas nauphoetae TaxID=2049346 RepID=A0ABQ9Y496_9EUKA|nr:putative ALA-interacting subunit 5 [Blattamonas nauphoetae]